MKHRWTIPLGISAAIAASAVAAPAQGDQEEMIARREAKLAEAWVENANWTTDYEAALSESKESGKLVFGYFTRSYAP